MDLFVTIPGILCIHILRLIVALHLNMRRNTDIFPVLAIHIIPIEIGIAVSIRGSILEFPYAI